MIILQTGRFSEGKNDFQVHLDPYAGYLNRSALKIVVIEIESAVAAASIIAAHACLAVESYEVSEAKKLPASSKQSNGT